MDDLLSIPTFEEAARLMGEAEHRNPGPWVQHSLYVAQFVGCVRFFERTKCLH
jgi:hypothetical protein